MIPSSVFTFHESSVWDPKTIREYLEIPEDQLNILRNLPGWSKSTDDSHTLRIEKDIICENSQSARFISDVTLESNKEKQNTELFDKNFETRKITLDAYKLKAGKLSKSTSLYEIDEITKILSISGHLKRSLSAPNIYLFSKNSYSENLTSEFSDKNSLPEKHSLSLLKPIYLPVTKKSGITEITVQRNSNISESKRKEEICAEKTKMEVASQLPVVIPSYVDKIKNNEIVIETLVENNAVSPSATFKSPSEMNVPSSNHPLTSSLISNNKFDNLVTEIESTNSTQANCLGLRDKNEENSVLVKETVSSDNCNPDTSGKEYDDLTSCKNKEPDVNIVNETEFTIVNSANKDKRVETNTDFQERAETNKPSDLFSQVKRHCTSEVNLVSSNEPENKLPSSSNFPKMDAQQTVVHQDVGDNKLEFAQALSVKRKLESKTRSSKRQKSTHGKHSLEERSLKKAGEISYSDEHIKIMLDIMRQFL